MDYNTVMALAYMTSYVYEVGYFHKSILLFQLNRKQTQKAAITPTKLSRKVTVVLTPTSKETIASCIGRPAIAHSLNDSDTLPMSMPHSESEAETLPPDESADSDTFGLDSDIDNGPEHQLTVPLKSNLSKLVTKDSEGDDSSSDSSDEELTSQTKSSDVLRNSTLDQIESSQRVTLKIHPLQLPASTASTDVGKTKNKPVEKSTDGKEDICGELQPGEVTTLNAGTNNVESDSSFPTQPHSKQALQQESAGSTAKQMSIGVKDQLKFSQPTVSVERMPSGASKRKSKSKVGRSASSGSAPAPAVDARRDDKYLMKAVVNLEKKDLSTVMENQKKGRLSSRVADKQLAKKVVEVITLYCFSLT